MFPLAAVALGIERTRFIIIFSRVRAPRNAQSWCLGRPPSTCAHDYVLAFLASPPPQNEKRAILREKGAYCELASSLSSLDTAYTCLQPFGALMVRQAMRAGGGWGAGA